MKPTKVIIQYLPVSFDLYRRYESTANYTSLLEETLAVYGPNKCVYLWSRDTHFVINEDGPIPTILISSEDKEEKNFAQVIFDDRADALKAFEASVNQELTFDDCILTLTIIEGTAAPIASLDDTCILKIFSYVDQDTRLELENVCRRWRDLSGITWSTMRTLIMPSFSEVLKKMQLFMKRCGPYLRKLKCIMDSHVVPKLIHLHAPNLVHVTVDVHFDGRAPQMFNQAFAHLVHLRSLDLTHHTNRFSFDFMRFLPIDMERILLRCTLPERMLLSPVDLGRFQRLLFLNLHGYYLVGQHVTGIEHMRFLAYLNLKHCAVFRSFLRQLQYIHNLSALIIPTAGLNDHIFGRIIQNNRYLEIVDIAACMSLTDRSVQFVSTLPYLNTLNVSLLDVHLNHMVEMPHLKTLVCFKCRNVGDEAIGRIIESAPNLAHLEVTYCGLTPRFFEITNAATLKRTNGLQLVVKTSFPYESFTWPKPISRLMRIDFRQSSSVHYDPSYGLLASYNDEKSELPHENMEHPMLEVIEVEPDLIPHDEMLDSDKMDDMHGRQRFDILQLLDDYVERPDPRWK